MEGARVDPERGPMAELYVRYMPAAIRLAYLLTGDRQQGEDLAHEAFVHSLTALNGRNDLDIALIPAETINEDGIFLDDYTLEAVRESLPMPIFPSYDFIDVLESESSGVLA